MTCKTDSARSPEVRALAAQKMLTAVFARLGRLDPHLRVFVAQVLEDAAAQIEMEACSTNDAEERQKLKAVLETVEFVRGVALAMPSSSEREH
jgi:hypothetical protein